VRFGEVYDRGGLAVQDRVPLRVVEPSATTSPVSPTTMTQPKGASGFPRAISTARRM
jgi:hypothetical protein